MLRGLIMVVNINKIKIKEEIKLTQKIERLFKLSSILL